MRTVLFSILSLFLFNCSSDSSDVNFDYPIGGSGSCTYNGHTLHVGEEGGCYYYNSSGNKTYVDRENCADCD